MSNSENNNFDELKPNQQFIDAKFVSCNNDFNSDNEIESEIPKKTLLFSFLKDDATKQDKDLEAPTLHHREKIDDERNTLLNENLRKSFRFCTKVRSQKTWKIIIIQLIILSLFFILVFASLLYHIMFPWWLQYQLSSYNPDSEFRFHTMALTAINSNSIKVKLDVRHNALLPESIPIVAGATEFFVTFSIGGLDIWSITIPKTDVWLNREIFLEWEIILSINEQQKKNLALLISKFSTPQGLQNWIIYISSSVPFTFFGKPMYKGLPLYLIYPMNDLAGTMESLLKVSNSLSPEKSSIHLIPKDKISGVLLSDKFEQDDIMRLPQIMGFFDLVWRTVDILVDDVSLTLKMTVAFENHTPFELLTIESLEYFLEMQAVKFVKLSIQNIGLKPNLNEDFVISFKLTFLDPDIDSLLVSKTINSILDAPSDVSSNSFQFAISGPVSISNFDLFPELTKDFRIRGELSNFLSYIPKSIINTLSSPTPDLTNAILDIFRTADLTILSDTINSKFGVNLPLNGLKLPRQFGFPYSITLSLYGENVKVMQAVFNPFKNQREGDKLLTSLGGSIELINTEEASVALSKSLNPIFSRTPTSSVLELKDFGLFAPGKPNFKWVHELFGNSKYLLKLPPIDKEVLFGVRTGKQISANNAATQTMNSNSAKRSILTKQSTLEHATNTANSPTPTNAETIKEDISNLPFLKFSDIDVAQLNDRPGFNVSVSLDANVPAYFPEFYIDLGYFYVDITMESVKMLGVEVPKDLKFLPDDKVLDINGTVIFYRDPKFAFLIQSIVDGVLRDRSLLPSHVGLTGLVLGGSKDVVTLNKIVIEMDTNLALKIATNLFKPNENGSYIAVDQRPLLDGLRIASAGAASPTFSLNSASGFTLALQTEILNPLPLSLSLGRIDLYGYMDDSNFIRASISPFKIGLGYTALTLDASISILGSFNTFVQNALIFTDAAYHKNYHVDLEVGVIGLKLTPTDAFNESAIIDQFETVKFGLPMGKILSLI